MKKVLPGDDVIVFLGEGWTDQVVLNPRLFQIGSSDLEDKVIAVSREFDAINPESESK